MMDSYYIAIHEESIVSAMIHVVWTKFCIEVESLFSGFGVLKSQWVSQSGSSEVRWFSNLEVNKKTHLFRVSIIEVVISCSFLFIMQYCGIL